MKKQWTIAEDKLLRKNYKKKSGQELAWMFKRPLYGVANRARELGLKIEHTLRNEPEEKISPKTYKKKLASDSHRILERHPVGKTDFFAKRKKRKFIVHKWTANEKRMVCRLHNKVSIKELASRLHQPGQRLRALTYRMGLGPTKKRAPLYNDQERSFILQNYRTMTYNQLAEKLKRPVSGVIDVAGRLGIKKQNQKE